MWGECNQIFFAAQFSPQPIATPAATEGSTSSHHSDGTGTSSQGRVPFSLIVPAYNEERRLPAAIRDIRAFFSGINEQFEVLIVVEKSKDRTVELAREAAYGEPRIQVIDNQVHRGKGYAVKSGMLRAKGEIVFFTDADLSTPLAEILTFLAHFIGHPETDVVIGSRSHAKSQVIKRQSLFRQTLGRTFNKLVQLISVPGIEDTQCGFKAFRATACREVFNRQTLNGFAFDVEILMLAQRLGYKIEVLPVRWINSPDSKVRIFIDPFKMLWDLLKIRLIVRKTIRAQPLSPVSSPSQKSLS
jgi:dolichyl-phosphate beta-glucosyltransferase